MTAIGYQYIRDRIVNRQVDPPTDMTLGLLQGWLMGYAQCQMDILELIDEIERANERP
jgi:hypothetical protein